MFVSFDDWTQCRPVVSLGTNAGSEPLPFQKWQHFKEAFTPEIVARAVRESSVPVRRCFDPFGGSGTSALACQFLGVHPTTAEVNPYLADVIEAKLSSYNSEKLIKDIGTIARVAKSKRSRQFLKLALPPTFVEPGVNGRWIFNKPVAGRLAEFLSAISTLGTPKHRRLFRVLLGGILIEVSNVVINGKGRRYRKNWSDRLIKASNVDELFFEAARNAVADIHRYSDRKFKSYELLRGDSRALVKNVPKFDLSVFSPPYPNSFDYTDVYNVELWLLGYMKGVSANKLLRQSTLCSHVQVSRDFPEAPQGSKKLDRVLMKLRRERLSLWDGRIPEMIGGYFSDLNAMLSGVRSRLSTGGAAWVVVGDSCYNGIRVPVAEIVADLCSLAKWDVLHVEPFRSMRASAQQGGERELDESLVVLRKS